MKKRPIQIQSEFFEKVWTNADLDAVFQYFDGEAGGLGASEPLDPVGYIDFYHALSSVVKGPEFEFKHWTERGNKLYIDFVMKARAKKLDKAIFWHGSAIGEYRDGKIAGGENFLDFVDLFEQLELVPEQVVELGLAGEEILQAVRSTEAIGTEFRRLFWSGYRAAESWLPSSEQLEVLFRSATFAMVITDSDDRIVEANPGFEKLVGGDSRSFSELITGKGMEAERRAREALLRMEIPSYRILLSLKGQSGARRVWVSAVLMGGEGESLRILRSLEREELIDDLICMQEDDRKLLAVELSRDVLEPVVALWSQFCGRAKDDPKLRVRCMEMTSKLTDSLRSKIRNLRNPVLEGVPLSQIWSRQKFNPVIDQADETVALLVYRLVSECEAHFQSNLEELKLDVVDQQIVGSIPVRLNGQRARLEHLQDMCRLLGGELFIEGEPTKMIVCLPCRLD